jgi:HD-GYP domain-containing protein (c-di-GMP phosphodiesterase class II)
MDLTSEFSLDGTDGTPPDGAFDPQLMAVLLDRYDTQATCTQIALDRVNDQLGALLDFTSQVDSLVAIPDPYEKLTQLLGHTLDAVAIIQIMDDEAILTAIDKCIAPMPTIELEILPAHFRGVIHSAIKKGQPSVLELDELKRRAIGGGSALLIVPPWVADQSCCWLSVRHWSQEPYSSLDLGVAASALSFCGLIHESVQMMEHLERNVLQTVRALTNAIDTKDRYTHGHSQRVSWLAKQFGQWLGMWNTDLRVLEWAGLLHDIGKIGVPEAILCKTGCLTKDEYAIIKQHPQMSYDVIAPVESLKQTLPAVLHHHENFDGSGYPAGLIGYECPLHARMIRLVDVFDALTSKRSYRDGLTIGQACDIIATGKGTATDPELTDAFIMAIKSWEQDEEHQFHEVFRHLDAVTTIEPSPDNELEQFSLVMEPRI